MDYITIPKLNPVCKYVVWIVGISPTHTTNPMNKKSALKLIKERHMKNQYATLMKCYSCVSSKNLMNIN